MSVPVTSGLLEKLKAVAGSGGVAGELFLSKFLMGVVDCLPLLGELDVISQTGTFVGAGGQLVITVPDGELWRVMNVAAGSSVASVINVGFVGAQKSVSPHVTELCLMPSCEYWICHKGAADVFASFDVACDCSLQIYVLRVNV